MTLTEAQVREIREGTRGVTPGPWDADEANDIRPPMVVAREVDAGDDGRAVYCKTEIATVADTADDEANAAHIARLDPQTVTALCDAWLENAALRALLAQAGEALDRASPLLTQAGNVAYNMKQTTSTVESAREFERISAWVDEARDALRTTSTAIQEATRS